ncbi:hypothetical protein SAMN05443247_07623 [Bradyrhizobium erythrophlei]|nr:hypothetical protein SAMN05443247_07623 [Bradyrhizobium erythrophlei]
MAIEQPEDEPTIDVFFVDEHGRQLVNEKDNIIVSSRTALVDRTKKDSN